MKKVLVTGSCGAIGKPIVERFIKMGCEVYGISLGPGPILDNYTHFVCDIRNSSEVTNIINTIGSIDILVNNAGVVEYKEFANTNSDNISKILDTNLKGPINVTHAALPYLSKGSIVVFVNSMAGVKDLKNMSLYCASKAGLRSFAAVLGEELRGRKIKVTSIHPGIVYTDVWTTGLKYPFGDDATQALSVQSVADIVTMIAMDQSNVEIKNISLFSNVEWW
jgi:NADP-dependent 3-hydroxy acid dehydrogenase YdfG